MGFITGGKLYYRRLANKPDSRAGCGPPSPVLGGGVGGEGRVPVSSAFLDPVSSAFLDNRFLSAYPLLPWVPLLPPLFFFSGGAPQECQSSIPRQARCRLVVCVGAVRLEEPVTGARVNMEGHRAAGTPQGLLQVVDIGLRLILIILGEVTQVGCS